jgi:hypothetical protein
MTDTLRSEEIHSIIKLSSSATNLLGKLKALPQSKDTSTNVSNLIKDIENYFETTSSSIAQIIKSGDKSCEFKVCNPHKTGVEFENLLVEGCVFYMLPKEDY